MDADTMMNGRGLSLRRGSSLTPRREVQTEEPGSSVYRRDDHTLLVATKKTLADAGFMVAEATFESKNPGGVIFSLSESLESFIAIAQALSARVVFVDAMYLQEDEFYGDDSEEPIDLCSIEPKLRPFRKHIGSCDLVEVAACTENHLIRYVESSHWYTEYFELLEKAQEEARAESEDAEDRREREREEREAETVELIRALATNQAFRTFMSRGRITLQNITAYIRENIEGAADVHPSTIREEARRLKDKSLLG